MNQKPPDFKETPYGKFHQPQKLLTQVGVLFSVFLASFVVGLGSVKVVGAASAVSQTLVAAPFLLILFMGYALWLVRAKAIVLHGVGMGLLSALFTVFVRRKRLMRVEDVLPTPEKLEEMAVKVQKAASSFRTASWLVATVWAVLVLMVESRLPAYLLAATVAIACILWGQLLSMLGRRGYLPIGEEE